jgi:hypothetical protein
VIEWSVKNRVRSKNRRQKTFRIDATVRTIVFLIPALSLRHKEHTTYCNDISDAMSISAVGNIRIFKLPLALAVRDPSRDPLDARSQRLSLPSHVGRFRRGVVTHVEKGEFQITSLVSQFEAELLCRVGDSRGDSPEWLVINHCSKCAFALCVSYQTVSDRGIG